MLSKLLAFILIISVVYISSVFLFPEFTDKYGNREWNMKIRAVKSTLDTLGQKPIDAGSLIDNARDIAKPYIDETKNTVKNIQNTASELKTVIDTKTKEIKEAKDSIEEAYNAINSAKDNVQKVIQYGSGGR